MTDPLGQSQVLPYLTELSKKGYRFHLISFEKNERFEKHRKQIKEMCTEAGIEWHPQDYTFGGVKQTLKQVRKMIRVSDYLFDRHQFEIIHCRSYISALAGMRLKKKYRVPFVFDMRGFWADERVDGKLWNLSNPLYKQIYRYFKKKERRFVQEADAIVSLTQAGKDEMQSWNYTGIDRKTTVIPCCVNLNLFQGIEKSSNLREQLNIGEKTKILGYVGSIGTWYMLSEMLDFYQVYRRTAENTCFLFISGEEPNVLINAAREKGIPEQEIRVHSVLHSEVPRYISLFDCSVFFILPSYSKKASSPTKQGELMAMGIPIVCNSGVGDTASIIEGFQAGSVVSEFNEAAYLKAIEGLFHVDTKRSIQGAHEVFSLEEGAKRYAEIYARISG